MYQNAKAFVLVSWYHGWLFFMSLYYFLFLIKLILKAKL